MSKKELILIVDDDRTNINILGSMLVNDYEILVATNGEQALKVVSDNPQLDLILLDVQMPGPDGFQVCQQLKQNQHSKDIPVIFITANSNLDAERIGLMMGAVDYITKPFNEHIVQLRVKNQMELKRQRDLLHQLSKIDGLTGISNRQRFDEYLEDEWQRGIRNKSSLALILLDIDFFKNFNDYYGHTEGDECLKKIAHSIQASLERRVDLAARYGGEEFACVLPNTSINGAKHMAEKIRTNIELLNIPHENSSCHSVASVSIGVYALLPTPGVQPVTLVKLADKNLYKAKELGRNQVVAIAYEQEE